MQVSDSANEICTNSLTLSISQPNELIFSGKKSCECSLQQVCSNSILWIETAETAIAPNAL